MPEALDLSTVSTDALAAELLNRLLRDEVDAATRLKIVHAMGDSSARLSHLKRSDSSGNDRDASL